MADLTAERSFSQLVFVEGELAFARISPAVFPEPKHSHAKFRELGRRAEIVGAGV